MSFEEICKKNYGDVVPKGGGRARHIVMKHSRLLRVRLCESLFKEIGVSETREVALQMGSGDDLGKFKVMFDDPTKLAGRRRFKASMQQNGAFNISVPIPEDIIVDSKETVTVGCEAISPANGATPYILMTFPPKYLEAL